MAAQRGGVELIEYRAAEVWAVRNAQAVAARRRAEEQAVAPHVGAACVGDGAGLRVLGLLRERAEDGVGGQGRADGGRKVRPE